MLFRLRSTLPVLGLCTFLYSQTPAPLGTVEGDVIDSATNQPIAHARVKLQAGQRALFTACDDKGHFQFQDVLPANYLAMADRPGYLPLNGQIWARLSPNQTRAELRIPLQPYASIAGKITDAAGVPLEGATVELFIRRSADSKRSTAPSSNRGALIGDPELMSAGNTTTTDDLGDYRLAPLYPGTYYVMAKVAFFPIDETERTTYYPRTLHASAAKAIALSAGQETTGIDIQVLRQSGVHISGHVLKPADSPPARSILVHTSVVAWRPDSPQEGSSSAPAFGPDSIFELKNVLPGSYVVEAVVSDQTDYGTSHTLLAGRRTLQVGEKDIDSFDIPMFPPVDVAGTVVFADTCPAVPVTIRPETLSRTRPRQQDTPTTTGAFTLTGLTPGTYVLTITPQPTRTAGGAYRVLSIKLDEREISATGFEVTGKSPGTLTIAMTCHGGVR